MQEQFHRSNTMFVLKSRVGLPTPFLKEKSKEQNINLVWPKSIATNINYIGYSNFIGLQTKDCHEIGILVTYSYHGS